MKTPNSTSIRTRLWGFAVVAMLLSLMSIVFTQWAWYTAAQYQLMYTKASKNNDILEQIVIYGNQIINNNRPEAKTLLADDIAQFQANIDALKFGGSQKNETETIQLPPAPAEVQAQLREIDRLWNPYRTQAEYLTGADLLADTLTAFNTTKRRLVEQRQNALLYITQHREMLLALQGQLLARYQALYQTAQSTLNAWVWTLWLGHLLLLLLGVIVVQRTILQPIIKIGHEAQHLGKSDLEQHINYPKSDEIGVLANTLDNMVSKIRHATHFIRQIERGNLSIPYPGLNGTPIEQDALAGALLNMREQMKTVASDEEERSWATQGQALFGQILQKYNDDIENFSYEIIVNLVKYLQANQGALFIVNETSPTEPYLDLVASYAYERRRYLERKVRIGEGLVGQAFKDADTIYLTDIPENYVDITSGLGGAQPKSVLVVPLKLIDRVYGVVEIASFYDIPQYQIQFLEKLSENIASNLYAARANEQTKRLLLESNKNAAQMRQQEQEMRQYLARLENAQREMESRQETLDIQTAALDNTLMVMELNIERQILRVNRLFLETFGYTEYELLHKDHKLLVPANQADDMQHERLWRDLRAGFSTAMEVKRVDKFGREVWLRATYTPIKDKNNQTQKVLKLAFNITEEKRWRGEFKEQFDAFRRSNAMIEFDPQGRIIDLNENFLEIMEYTREELLGKDHFVLVSQEEGASKSYLAMWHRLRQGSYHIGEIKRLTKSGKTVWFQGSFNPILDLNGQPYKIVEILHDITDRKNAELRLMLTTEELQTKEANLVALLNNTDDVIYTVNAQYRITMLNESTRRLYEQIGANVRLSSQVLDSLPRTYYYIWKAYYDRALGGEKFAVEQSIFSETTAQKIYLSISFNPIYNESREVAGVAVFARDISARKQREMDISDFVRKQTARTARMLESQRQNLQNLTHSFAQERQALQAQLHEKQEAIARSQYEQNFLKAISTAAICVNHHLEVLQYNDAAKALLRTWNLYIQPDYFLPDVFSQGKYAHWEALCRQALRGEYVQAELTLRYRYAPTAHTYFVQITPIFNQQQQATRLLINITNTTPIQLAKHRLRQQNRQEIAKRHHQLRRSLEKAQAQQQQQLEETIRQTQRLSQKQAQRLELLEHSHELVLMLDRDMCLVGYNRSTWQVFHEWLFYLQPEYFLPDTFHIRRYDKWYAWIARAMAGEHFTTTEWFVHRRERRLRAFAIELSPEFDAQGKVMGVCICAQEITAWASRRQKH